MEEKKLVPKRRFRGFEGEWSITNLAEMSTVLTGGTPNTNRTDYWYPKEVSWMSSGEINKSRIKSTNEKISIKGYENSSARWIKKHSVLMALAGQGKTRGKVAINEIELTTNQSIAAILPEKNLYYEFLYQNLIKRYEELRLSSSGDGTRGGLNKQIIESLIIKHPIIIEQQKIGSFFKVLDERIANQERKIAKVKAVKEAYLTEMFPQEGESVPKRRFAGFEGEWEVVRVDDIADRLDNLRIPITASDRIPGDTPYYGANGIQDYVKGYTHDGENVLIAEDGANDINDYPVHYTTGKVWVNNHAHVLKAKENLSNNLFLSVLFKMINMAPYLVGGGRAKLNSEIMMNIRCLIPSPKEQQKIGQFFKNLDEQIQMEEDKLEKLKKMKEAYLEEMFV